MKCRADERFAYSSSANLYIHIWCLRKRLHLSFTRHSSVIVLYQLEEVVARRKLGNHVLNSRIELGERVEIVVPREELLRVELELLADVFAAGGYDRMHHERADP